MAKAYNFGEKKTEYNAKLGKEVDVWQSPKYLEAKKKAIEIIESGINHKQVLSEADFWILMNATKSGKMAYTGLIISHNGCLKINDALQENDRFKPSCMSLDKDGYKGSLVYSYSNDDQGIYEVGEVSDKNCTNAYPYAMALKRCMDRVILKSSKLAYSGIYSDSEAEEFKNDPDETKEVKAETPKETNSPETKTAAKDPLAEVKAAYQDLITYCKENGHDIKEVAKIYSLNSKSTAAEFKTALNRLILGDSRREEPSNDDLPEEV
jgi:hypothetical protein